MINTSKEILIIDDVRENIQLLQSCLATQNHKIRTALNAQTALLSINAKKPDIILLDINMPQMDGFEVSKILKSDDNTKDIPIIFISGNSDTEDKVNAFNAGGVDYITKPFANEEVLARVNMHLELSSYKNYLANENKTLISKLEKQVKEANKANEAKSNFLSVISHEIRTPLNAIIGFVKRLKDIEKDKTKLNYLETVDKSSSILLNVMNDLIDMSKIESGKLVLEFCEFNIIQELTTTYDLFKHVAEEKGINMMFTLSPTTPKYIISDKLRIKQIIANLLSNAIKFTDKGKNVEFNISFDIDSESLYVEVVDEGIGIKEENLPRIVEEFVQADNSTARKYGGSGLGLAIVNKLLKLLKSHLSVKSKIGHGTTMSFEIPIKIPSKSIEENIVQTKKDEIFFNGQKVLIAEDNIMNQMLIKLLLQDLNLDVFMANDGVEAIAMYIKSDFDLVLMDINMPNKNGIEAMQEIKYYNKLHNKNTPVVAVTANAVSGDREMYLDEGFDEYIPKPINPKKFADTLKLCLIDNRVSK